MDKLIFLIMVLTKYYFSEYFMFYLISIPVRLIFLRLVSTVVDIPMTTSSNQNSVDLHSSCFHSIVLHELNHDYKVKIHTKLIVKLENIVSSTTKPLINLLAYQSQRYRKCR